jgi:alpha-tubulin suppressor-like RCC1 family protein
MSVSGLSQVVAIAAGGDQTTAGGGDFMLVIERGYNCALLSGGSIQCWGNNTSGQYGNGTIVGGSSRVAVLGVSQATAIATGGNHTCALLTSGAVQCWGENSSGQLGTGNLAASLVPVAVTGL